MIYFYRGKIIKTIDKQPIKIDMAGEFMIRKANIRDIERIMEIVYIAKSFMKNMGNPNQWKEEYPQQAHFEKDIAMGNCYVVENEGVVRAVFVFVIGKDPTYSIIKDGNWLNNEEYGTLHRIASDGKFKGVFNTILNYAKMYTSNIRIDTHENNTIMIKLFEKNGFKKCGKIKVEDGSERIAYHWVEVE